MVLSIPSVTRWGMTYHVQSVTIRGYCLDLSYEWKVQTRLGWTEINPRVYHVVQKDSVPADNLGRVKLSLKQGII